VTPTRLQSLAAALAAGPAGTARPPKDLDRAALVCLAGTGRRRLEQVASAVLDAWARELPDAHLVTMAPACACPFAHPSVPELPGGPVVIWVPDLHEAFVNRQPAATHLVTTQPGYLGAEWTTALTAHGQARMLATAHLPSLRTYASDLLARRGVFRTFLVDVDPVEEGAWPSAARDGGGALDEESDTLALAHAFRMDDAARRLEVCVDVLSRSGRTAPALLAAASACMEVNDLAAAARDLADAVALAPGWSAAQFELGKVRLRTDDMAGASVAFRAAASALPTFGPAWANLGATLGELDRPAEALDAFEHAAACDPASHQTINNIGVVRRELGQLGASEAAFREVTRHAPDMAFGYYNLGHTLFLQGRFRAALSAYALGQSRDPDRNPVQAARLATCRLATGDADGALADLRRATAPLPREYRRQILAETSALIWALITQEPDLRGWEPVQAWVSRELEQLS